MGKAASNAKVELSVVQLGRIFRQEFGGGSPLVSNPGSDPAQNGANGGSTEVMPSGGGGEVNAGDSGKSDDSALGTKDLPVTVTSLNAMVDQADQANRIMTLLLGGIAAVSLLVGGLGIMNIMLVAVTERTGEIGVRRALGARQIDLMVQFILEALYLSGIGAILGVVLGIVGLNVFARYGFDTAVSFTAIRVAVTVALGSGLVFGVYPAANAAAISPVEALRQN